MKKGASKTVGDTTALLSDLIARIDVEIKRQSANADAIWRNGRQPNPNPDYARGARDYLIAIRNEIATISGVREP